MLRRDWLKNFINFFWRSRMLRAQLKNLQKKMELQRLIPKLFQQQPISIMA